MSHSLSNEVVKAMENALVSKSMGLLLLPHHRRKNMTSEMAKGVRWPRGNSGGSFIEMDWYGKSGGSFIEMDWQGEELKITLVRAPGAIPLQPTGNSKHTDTGRKIGVIDR